MAADGARKTAIPPGLELARFSISEDDAWLIGDFAMRSQAVAILLSLHCRGRDEAELLFHLAPHDGDGDLAARMAAVAAGIWPDRRASDYAVQAQWSSIAHGGRDRLLLAMPLAARGAGRLVLTALYDLDAGAGDHAMQDAAIAAAQPMLSIHFRLWLAEREHLHRMEGMAAALDATDFATYLIDAAGQILFANACGERLAEIGDGVRRAGAMLAATDVTDSVKLRVAIDHIVSLDRSGEAASPSATIVPLRRGANRRPLVAVVIAPETPPCGPDDPAAIVQIFNPEVEVADLLLPICQLYSLSPAETRLVALLVEGLSVGEAAVRMKVKVPTLRTYLKQIFAKTQTGRQSDLIRLMMGSMIRARSPGGYRTL